MSKYKDLTGMKFGRLKVIKRVEDKIYKKSRVSQWLCKCDCNGLYSEKIVKGSNLLQGKTKSCGCLLREHALIQDKLNKKCNRYDLSGEYGIGYTRKEQSFYFDLQDYDKLKNYCWYNDKNGYILTRINNKLNRLHRVILFGCNDNNGNILIDHINGNPNDNRKINLRQCVQLNNAKNMKMSKRNTTGVKGVYWDKKRNKWKSVIGVDNQFIYLGRFENLNDAIKARQQAEEKYFGEYSYDNSQEYAQQYQINEVNQ